MPELRKFRSSAEETLNSARRASCLRDARSKPPSMRNSGGGASVMLDVSDLQTVSDARTRRTDQGSPSKPAETEQVTS